MSEILSQHIKTNVITIGRIGGQYAKPRSAPYEIINEGTNEIIHSYL
jgi:3-deoxy-D-arabino-heptulosonate 7-phosphate (DAHP) synthase class II